MLDFVLVGCGRIAQRHAQLLGESQIEGARLVAVCDTAPERARALAQRYGIPFYSDLRQMMDLHRPDVAAILTESGNHAKPAIEAASCGAHVMVEKPMALTLPDADAMIAACDSAGVKLFVVKQNRFNRPVIKLREALEANRFGRLTMGTVRLRWCRTQSYYDQAEWRGTWALDGGVLTNQASHHIDLLIWMLGEVDSVVGMTRTALADIEAEDTAAVLLRFSSGAIGIIEATTATRPKDLEGSLSILGEKGTVEIGGFAVNEMRVWNFSEESAEDSVVAERYSVNPPDVYGFGHREYYQHVVKAIEGNGPNLVDGLEGRKSLELITAIYESVEAGREISLHFRPRRARLGKR